jgi:trehalose 6-phosphate phosphatase
MSGGPGVLPSPQSYWALFLDVDGTLAELAPSPDQARIPASVLDALKSLRARLGGALALVSGRAIESIDLLCRPHRFCAAGQHGMEWRGEDAVLRRADDPKGLMRWMEKRVATWHAHHPSLLVEYKGLSIAVHYRDAPDLADTVRYALQRLITGIPELCVTEGKMVCELRFGSVNKGTAIEQFMCEAPFSGRQPVFIGDDHTDEDGFRAVNRLKGLSIKVGSGDTAARHLVASPRDVQQWLCGEPTLHPAEETKRYA